LTFFIKRRKKRKKKKEEGKKKGGEIFDGALAQGLALPLSLLLLLFFFLSFLSPFLLLSFSFLGDWNLGR
jgi:hypothetical protein